jgi:18S rRNA (guanine1575-N7)-methyltransferase
MRRKSWTIRGERPEEAFRDVTEYYAPEEVRKYHESSAIKRIQARMAERALEIASFEKGSKLLDAGCGTGISMQTAINKGFRVKGIDPVKEMIEIARGKGLDAVQGSMDKLLFGENSFDGIISISSLQWPVAGKSLPEITNTARQIGLEFYRVLKAKGKAVIQFYPASEQVLEAALKGFMKAGFECKPITDNPDNPRKRKIYLLLEKS